MSDWIGANTYRIESYIDRRAAVALSGGDKADGTKVVMWNNDPRWNDRFEFVYAGVGQSGKDEYHIINRNSGTYMTYGEGAPNDAVYGNILPPRSPRTRWCIVPTRNNTGTYWIVAAANTKMMLVPSYYKIADGSQVDIWKGGLDDKNCWWYLKLSEDAILQCPDLRSGGPKL
ncbi:hypothetical protein CB0940_04926 [Cercospora beticola]|uniref:Ricin B lectin domain-containing protein n=1 Tax=Cercospora beticola TaxID=122368 RepID=A0A2G5HMR1_CERBT|nr:hypothetical protein CB0940_04926 [Cercospora beticola]PIA93837.1 hypothetical protein CB0940_04926 [Cercospora beticola]WPB02211.1 hypothetical protein RHO25_006845 [Cercospora beticola]CAK1362927.1 unnamed protein product [Cercospora beticola]